MKNITGTLYNRWRNAILKQTTPGQFMRFSARLLWPLSVLTIVMLMIGLYLAFHAPEDYQQGSTVRIMFIHVPLAWLSMLCYAMMSVSAIVTLIWRHPLADIALKTAAPIGATFTALALVTGSLWGKPTWGAFWVWDGRLTSMFILLLIYLGIIALSRAFEENALAAKATAILTLVGFINIPIIKFSVEWWNTLHQKASFSRSSSAIDPAFMTPLTVMALALLLVFCVFQLLAMRNEILRRQVIAAQYQAARRFHAEAKQP